MNELREQGVDVGDNNLPNPENVTESTPVAKTAPPVMNWKTDCIVPPRRAVNLKNSFAPFRNHSKANVMKMSRLDMFLIMMSMEFIEDTVINKTN